MKRSDKPCGPVLITTTDGHEYEAAWVERINKYTGCRKWRRTAEGLTKKERWIDDKEVVSWRESK